MEIKKTDNKSLIMYTSMIFVAAIVMIVISYFAQQHLDNLKTDEVNKANVSLSKRAEAVSEENMQLVELNKGLKEEKTKLEEENKLLTAERDGLLKQADSYKALIEVYTKIIEGDEEAAKRLLDQIYTEDLNQEQKDMFDYLAKELQ